MLHRLVNLLYALPSLVASAWLGGNLALLIHNLLQVGTSSSAPSAIGGAATGMAIGGLALRYLEQANTSHKAEMTSTVTAHKAEMAAIVARAEKREDRLLAVVENNTRVLTSLLERLDPREPYEGSDRRRQLR